MPVRQKDIAAYLGVSRPWVARALGGDPKISVQARQKVEAAARELGYDARVNHHARSLGASRHGRRLPSGIIGCVGFNFKVLRQFPYWLHLTEGIQEAVHQAGMEMLLINDPSAIGWHKVDGVLIHSDGADEILSGLPPEMHGVSVMIAAQNTPCVLADDYGGARQATRHLLELGHQRIACLMHLNSRTIQERLRGYHAALAEAGIAPGPGWVRELAYNGTSLRTSGCQDMADWLQEDWRELGCTALLAHNDQVAMGVMEMLQSAEVQVPQDVSVIGFDGTEECETSMPRLSSVHVPLYDIGAAATGLLRQLVNGEVERDAAVASPLVLPTRLDIRESCAPPQTG